MKNIVIACIVVLAVALLLILFPIGRQDFVDPESLVEELPGTPEAEQPVLSEEPEFPELPDEPTPEPLPEPEPIPEPEPDPLPEPEAPAPDEPAVPVWAQTPAISAAEPGLTLNQQPLTVYDGTTLPLLCLNDFSAVTEGAILHTPAEDGTASCTFTLGETELAFTTGEDTFYDGERWYVSRDALLQTLTLQSFHDPDLNHTYYTTGLPAAQVPDGHDVPVLMYHAVSDDTWGIPSLFVSPAAMEEQLIFLLDNGYTPIWFEDLPNVAEIEKPILLTFDDGYDDNYTELFPLLEKYQVKATIFVIADRLGTPHKMTEAQIRELSQSGLVSIQSHSMTHGFLNQMTAEEQEYELLASKKAIARITGKVPVVLSYPEGKFDQTTLELMAQHYDYGLLMNGWCYTTGEDRYQITRYFVGRETDIWTFRDMAAGY